ncbi:hypothetical protein K6Q96_06765 [Grimontia kaedaensis]|uniref:Uncharacterized protein n=1 Tax=Grimontia kaedaensis TaxID=2872157 RepID=A0ABY4WXI5_9GAMM|nr:hypothetical protein [Grimontia kaedaensis]USH03689.1 hypothetical protein K6Q96_06765 [Grimontia kaedaensis]
MFKKIIAVAMMSVAFSPVYADSFCKGKIETLAVGRGSVLLISGPGGLPSTYLCDLSEKQNNVDPEACRAIYSLLLAAKAQDKSVNITFNPNIKSCSGVASWNWARDFNWAIVP